MTCQLYGACFRKGTFELTDVVFKLADDCFRIGASSAIFDLALNTLQIMALEGLLFNRLRVLSNITYNIETGFSVRKSLRSTTKQIILTLPLAASLAAMYLLPRISWISFPYRITKFNRDSMEIALLQEQDESCDPSQLETYIKTSMSYFELNVNQNLSLGMIKGLTHILVSVTALACLMPVILRDRSSSLRVQIMLSAVVLLNIMVISLGIFEMMRNYNPKLTFPNYLSDWEQCVEGDL